jgi:hypothetical protein
MQCFSDFFAESVEGSTDFYHVTKASNLSSILQHGLRPNLVTIPGLKTKTPRIYLFSNINNENIDMIESFQHKIESLGSFFSPKITHAPDAYEDVVILKVSIPKSVKIYPDPRVHIRATNCFFISNKTIAPNDIEVIYNGSIDNIGSFVDKQGIRGNAYETKAIVQKQYVDDLISYFKKFISQTEADAVDIDTLKSDSINLYYVDEDSSDKLTYIFVNLYEDRNGSMVTWIPGKLEKFNLNISKADLEIFLRKKFNARIVSGEKETQKAIDDLIK